MKQSLQAGARFSHSYVVPDTKTVPHVYPESPDFQAMPEVFATAYLVGLMEWTCILLLKPHLDEGERTLGTHIDISHIAATPPGHTVTVEAEVTELDGRRVWFSVSAHDGDELIGEGRHQRAAVNEARFTAKVAEKAAARTAGAEAAE